jgi:exopolyphosphatase / guanosine-5'-triphosphate,3'-diphosphate pyrophosphatase
MPETKVPVTVAAIDVGSSAIRMEISEIHTDGSFRTLERLSKGVALGKDTFTNGNLSEETMQTACQALTDFSRVMKTYDVTKYRAVATSAVREAGNADTFLDRAYLRSGIEIDVIDGSEENRLVYMAIHEAVRGMSDLQTRNVLVVEVGGGNSEISLLQGGETVNSGTFALGAVRMRQSLMGVRGDLKHRMKILDRQIKNSIANISNTIPVSSAEEVIALGGDIRFAAREISGTIPGQDGNAWIMEKKNFIKFCSEIVRYDTDELVRRYNMTYPQAETLVPSLLAYKNMIDITKAERIHVLSASIRVGLLLDMARREFGKEMESFELLIVASARSLAKKFHCDENHTEQVRKLALLLFDQMQKEHRLGTKEKIFLETAAILHDVGSFISDRSHHKHTQYIIASSEIFGLSRQELNIISNIARYHRKSPPTRSHIAYTSLDRESRVIVSKLAALLRVADALDQDYSMKIRNLKITKEEEHDRFILEAETDGDLTMERLSVEAKGDLFRQIYGAPIVLRQVEKIE